ncbi:MAG: tRNA modification GTPase [Planctomycetales bacterium]|nr:tRNA modification GTPase [Planctomycetales bacterium]
MVHTPDDTIVAIASAPGGAARGIIRISGPETLVCVKQCFETTDPLNIRTANSVKGRLTLSGNLPAIEARLYLWPTDKSFTAQPTAEFHTLGSQPLLESAVQSICANNARLAEPGEFTMRAFLAGRIDLPQAEAVLGVINANSKRQLETALHQLSGGLSGPLNELRDRMLNLLADLEAGLDFVDEDIEFVTTEQLAAGLEDAVQQVGQLCKQIESRSDTQQIPRAVLHGRPNVGKSTLWNAIGNDSSKPAIDAIVSDVAGTTRDYLSKAVEIEGLRCELVDTAGVEQARQPTSVDGAAQAMTQAANAGADLVLYCLESTLSLNEWELNYLSHSHTSPVPMIVVLTKIDAASDEDVVELQRSIHCHANATQVIATSTSTRAGIKELCVAIRAQLDSHLSTEGRALASTATRCKDSLRLAEESLSRARELNAVAAGEELVAAELRLALNELGKVAGAVYTDDVLDRIFSRFCIGK